MIPEEHDHVCPEPVEVIHFPGGMVSVFETFVEVLLVNDVVSVQNLSMHLNPAEGDEDDPDGFPLSASITAPLWLCKACAEEREHAHIRETE